MTNVTTLPWGRPLMAPDLEALPDDGYRHELVDGTLVMTPAPSRRHQEMVTALWRLLDDHRPPDLWVTVAPFDVVLAPDTVLEPDVLVARRDQLTDRNLPAAPVLAVEVLSPATARVDLTLKRDRYRAAGVPSYWTVDPDAVRLRAWELAGRRYDLVADVTGTRVFRAERPFPVDVIPAALLEDE
jgi:Uma2 family endonuclease